MSRVQRFLDVLDNKALPAITQRTAEDELLITMLAHMFFADDDFADSELAVLRRLVGEMNDTELRAYVSELIGRHLEFSTLAETFPSPDDRDRIVTLAEHGIWGDNVVEPGEVDMIERLMAALGIEAG